MFNKAVEGEEIRVRKWSNVELQHFAKVLVDEDDSLLHDLETRALSREEDVEKIKKELGKNLSRNQKLRHQLASLESSVNGSRIISR